MTHTCPNCGYCPHCGRSDRPMPVERPLPWLERPYFPEPYMGGATSTTPMWLRDGVTITC